MKLRWLMQALGRKDDLTEELESHLRMAVADRVARGESPAEARRAAMREFGNVPLIADVTRERWGWMRLEHLLQDLQFAFRQMRRSPGFHHHRGAHAGSWHRCAHHRSYLVQCRSI